jgi:hypothetical protein
MSKLRLGFGLYSSKGLKHRLWITKEKDSILPGNNAQNVITKSCTLVQSLHKVQRLVEH